MMFSYLAESLHYVGSTSYDMKILLIEIILELVVEIDDHCLKTSVTEFFCSRLKSIHFSLLFNFVFFLYYVIPAQKQEAQMFIKDLC